MWSIAHRAHKDHMYRVLGYITSQEYGAGMTVRLAPVDLPQIPDRKCLYLMSQVDWLGLALTCADITSGSSMNSLLRTERSI